MKKILPLMFVMLLIITSFVSALTPQEIQDIQKNLGDKYATSLQISGNPPTPLEAIQLALKNSPEFRKEFIKSIVIIMVLMCLTIVDVILKGFAMWRASKNNSRLWFWLLLIISTLGILPLCYLIFSKKHKEEHKKK